MPQYVTRKEGVELVQDELGIPLTVSAVEKHAAAGTGPEPDAVYGRTYLYTPENFLRWAMGLAGAPVESYDAKSRRRLVAAPEAA